MKNKNRIPKTVKNVGLHVPLYWKEIYPDLSKVVIAAIVDRLLHDELDKMKESFLVSPKMHCARTKTLFFFAFFLSFLRKENYNKKTVMYIEHKSIGTHLCIPLQSIPSSSFFLIYLSQFVSHPLNGIMKRCNGLCSSKFINIWKTSSLLDSWIISLCLHRPLSILIWTNNFQWKRLSVYVPVFQTNFMSYYILVVVLAALLFLSAIFWLVLVLLYEHGHGIVYGSFTNEVKKNDKNRVRKKRFLCVHNFSWHLAMKRASDTVFIIFSVSGNLL